ncbi:hypothetical protein [Embleya scabrispora]|nr:hypothetical protein [Embleya scabrispora]
MTLARGEWIPDGTPGTVFGVAILVFILGMFAFGLWSKNRKRN